MDSCRVWKPGTIILVGATTEETHFSRLSPLVEIVHGC
jgi:replication-associated recombination protein RarA